MPTERMTDERMDGVVQGLNRLYLSLSPTSLDSYRVRDGIKAITQLHNDLADANERAEKAGRDVTLYKNRVAAIATEREALESERDALAAQVEVLWEGMGKIAARTVQPKEHNPQQDMAYQLDGCDSIARDTLAEADAIKCAKCNGTGWVGDPYETDRDYACPDCNPCEKNRVRKGRDTIAEVDAMKGGSND